LECRLNIRQDGYMEGPTAENHEPQCSDKECDCL
jgi:hypothetical protein